MNDLNLSSEGDNTIAWRLGLVYAWLSINHTVLVGCTPLFWRSPFPPRSYRTRACVRSFVHFMPCRAFPGPVLRFSSQSTCPAQLCRCQPGARAVHLPRVRACLAPFCCRGWSLAAAVQFVASSVARSISGVAAQSPSVRVDISRFRSYLGECASVNICAHVTWVAGRHAGYIWWYV